MKHIRAVIILPFILCIHLVFMPMTLIGDIPGDFEPDCDVDFSDFAILASAWLTQNGEPNYNPKCDISEPNDGVINEKDLSVFVEFWLTKHPCDMTYIPGGSFDMGDSIGDGDLEEVPVHTVTLDSFYMGKYEITNSQYCQYLNSALSQGLITVSNGVVYKVASGTFYGYCDTSTSKSDSQIDYSSNVFSVRTKGDRNMSNDPMMRVSWYGAVAYCNWRSLEEGYQEVYDLTTWSREPNKSGFRLPTEAEWEYAARGGLSGKRFPWGNTITHNQANYYSEDSYNYDISPTHGYHPIWSADGIMPYTSPLGSFPANGFGLYDMAGNVREWCNDWFGPGYYFTSPQNNPTGSPSGTTRVNRSGYWGIIASYIRVSSRSGLTPSSRGTNLGFRIVLDSD